MQTSNGTSDSYHNNERFTHNHTRVKEACLVRVHMSEVCAVMFICVYVCRLQLHRTPKQRTLHTQSHRCRRGMCVNVNRAVACTHAMAGMCADMQATSGVSEYMCVHQISSNERFTCNRTRAKEA